MGTGNFPERRSNSDSSCPAAFHIATLASLGFEERGPALLACLNWR